MTISYSGDAGSTWNPITNDAEASEKFGLTYDIDAVTNQISIDTSSYGTYPMDQLYKFKLTYTETFKYDSSTFFTDELTV